LTKSIVLAILILVVGIAVSCTDDIAQPVEIDTEIGLPEVPRDIQTRVADGVISLSWTVDDPTRIKQFMIFRGDTSSIEQPELIDSTAGMSYIDSTVRNNVRYIYRIASHSVANLIGDWSAAVSATAALYSLIIEEGASYTSTLVVDVDAAAPPGTRHIMLTHDTLSQVGKWLDFEPPLSWELEPGDGVKRVFAKFRDLEGNETLKFYSDDIVLDTRAAIDSITENSGGSVLSVGDELHLALYANEANGEAAAEISGVGIQKLYDDGTAGDAVAGDGIYELDWIVPAAVDVRDGAITGSFTDAAGNQADDKNSPTLINIANPPASANLSAYVKSETEIELSWTRSQVADFAGYLLFRSTAANVDTNSKLLRQETNVNSSSYADADLEPATNYYYAVYTVDGSGLRSKSNVVSATTEANEAPEAVELFSSDRTESSVSLGWSRNSDADFASYHVYRSQSATVPISTAALKGVVTSQSSVNFTDSDVEPGTTYRYVVVVYDEFGAASTPSNTVEVTTDEEETVPDG
jgi:hypothetical protein